MVNLICYPHLFQLVVSGFEIFANETLPDDNILVNDMAVAVTFFKDKIIWQGNLLKYSGKLLPIIQSSLLTYVKQSTDIFQSQLDCE